MDTDWQETDKNNCFPIDSHKVSWILPYLNLSEGRLFSPFSHFSLFVRILHSSGASPPPMHLTYFPLPTSPFPHPHNELPHTPPPAASVRSDPASHAVNALLSAVTNLGEQLRVRCCQGWTWCATFHTLTQWGTLQPTAWILTYMGFCSLLKGPVKTISN